MSSRAYARSLSKRARDIVVLDDGFGGGTPSYVVRRLFHRPQRPHFPIVVTALDTNQEAATGSETDDVFLEESIYDSFQTPVDMMHQRFYEGSSQTPVDVTHQRYDEASSQKHVEISHIKAPEQIPARITPESSFSKHLSKKLARKEKRSNAKLQQKLRKEPQTLEAVVNSQDVDEYIANMIQVFKEVEAPAEAKAVVIQQHAEKDDSKLRKESGEKTLFESLRPVLFKAKTRWPVLGENDRVRKVTIFKTLFVFEFKRTQRIIGHYTELEEALTNCRADKILYMICRSYDNPAFSNPQWWTQFFDDQAAATKVLELNIQGIWRNDNFYQMCRLASVNCSDLHITNCNLENVTMGQLKNVLPAKKLRSFVADTRQWENKSFEHNLKHVFDLKLRAGDGFPYDALTLVVTDFPRYYIHEDYFSSFDKFVDDKLTILVDDEPDDASLNILKDHDFQLADVMLFEDTEFVVYEAAVIPPLDKERPFRDVLIAVGFRIPPYQTDA